MKFELKSLSLNLKLSEETPSYSAKVYLDGKYLADVSNHGHGGPDNVYFSDDYLRDANRLEDLNKKIGEFFPIHKYEIDGEDHSFPENLEIICHGLVWDADAKKRLKRELKTKVLTLNPEQKIECWKARKGSKAPLSSVISGIRINYPDYIILNSLVFDEAWTIMKDHG